MALYLVPGTQATESDRVLIADCVQLVKYGCTVDTGGQGIEVKFYIEDRDEIVPFLKEKLQKFIKVRGDATAYVNKNYGYDWCDEEYRTRKITEVNGRVLRAQEILAAIESAKLPWI